MAEITITEYAVRVKGTQRYLPRSQRRDGRGGSHLEPIDFSVPRSEWPVKSQYARNMQIRSYPERRAAENLLSAWVKGAVSCHRGNDDGDYYEENYLISKPHRNREDMEIVEITIILPI